MKLPCGISDFARLRRDGYYYQDRTGYMSVLESLVERYGAEFKYESTWRSR
ncbi:MAG: hypothetical protein NW241_10080 [Bacteroidia bacterium]|nr:hypothetical protein [Bacteroidia bacterium]